MEETAVRGHCRALSPGGSNVWLTSLACHQKNGIGQQALLARTQRVEHRLEDTVVERDSLREQMTQITRPEESARASTPPQGDCDTQQSGLVDCSRGTDGDVTVSSQDQPTSRTEGLTTHEASKRICPPFGIGRGAADWARPLRGQRHSAKLSLRVCRLRMLASVANLRRPWLTWKELKFALPCTPCS